MSESDKIDTTKLNTIINIQRDGMIKMFFQVLSKIKNLSSINYIDMKTLGFSIDEQAKFDTDYKGYAFDWGLEFPQLITKDL
ncbi:unnamed protein product [marine sediment metagenome]|uniref:Uncharacterized protein n=1 Tax=marine sediment metagenome TaxID=412755 RepID=X1EH04_9ZZZZ